MTDKTNDSSIPPKLNLRPQAAGDDDGKKHTTRVDLPPAPVEPPPTLKKKTSRIPLDQTSAEPGALPGAPVPGMGASKTIRLSPPMAMPTITVPPSAKAMSGALTIEDVKRQTSRISLDSVMADTDASAPGQTVPKTIRIKRPSSIQSVPVAHQPALEVTPEEEAAVDNRAKTVTSRVDIPELEDAETGQATQRKTIKIRRAEGGTVKAAPRSMAVARLEAQAAARSQQEVAAPHGAYSLLAAVAVVLLCIMIYLLLAQAYPSLGWRFPGHIS